jgi:hypothetical protein
MIFVLIFYIICNFYPAVPSNLSPKCEKKVTGCTPLLHRHFSNSLTYHRYCCWSLTHLYEVDHIVHQQHLTCLSKRRILWYDIFNCNWVATRWQLFSTHYTQTIQGTSQNKHHIEQHKKIYRTQKIHRATQKIHRAKKKFGRVRAVPRLCGHYPGICLTTEEKARKNLSQGSHT